MHSLRSAAVQYTNYGTGGAFELPTQSGTHVYEHHRAFRHLVHVWNNQLFLVTNFVGVYSGQITVNPINVWDTCIEVFRKQVYLRDTITSYLTPCNIRDHLFENYWKSCENNRCASDSWTHEFF